MSLRPFGELIKSSVRSKRYLGSLVSFTPWSVVRPCCRSDRRGPIEEVGPHEEGLACIMEQQQALVDPECTVHIVEGRGGLALLTARLRLHWHLAANLRQLCGWDAVSAKTGMAAE